MTSPTERPRRRKWRWLRWTIWTFVIIVVVVSTLAYVITRPTVLARLVAWQLGRHIGGDVSIRRVDSLGGGRYRLLDVTIDAPGWPGPSGRVAFIDEAVVTIDQALFQTLRIEPLEVDVVRGTLRLAQRGDDLAAMNITALSEARRGEGVPGELPRLLVRDLRYEMGVAESDGTFIETGSTRVTGALLPEGGDPGWLTVNFMEVAGQEDRRTPGGIRLRGRFNELTLEHELRLSRLRLDDRLRGLSPALVREWWSRMSIEGEIERATATWTIGTRPRVEVALAQTALTLPIEAGVPWVQLRDGRMERTSGRPRLRVERGVILLDGDSFRLENLSGDIVGTSTDVRLAVVPFRLDMTISELPVIDWEDRQRWLDEALATAPFTLDLELPDFKAPKATADGQPGGAVELPLAVADIMESLHMTDWRINVEMHIRREPPMRAAGAPAVAGDLTWTGTALIDDASMTYERFQFPLHDMRAFLRFDKSQVIVESFQGRGPNGGDVVVRGRVAPPGDDAGFELQVIAEDIPLDATLINALPPEPRKAIFTLVHEPSWQGLIDGGAIPREALDAATPLTHPHGGSPTAESAVASTRSWRTTDQLPSLRAERQRLLAANDAANAAAADPSAPPPSAAAAAARATRLVEIERRIALASWELGGAMDFDLKVHRIAGPGNPIEESGTFDLAGVTGVLDEFPYPFKVSEGRIVLAADEVRLEPPGLDFTTAGGGTGRATGVVAFPKVDGKRVVRPNLRIVIADDRVSPCLLAAIPPSAAQRRLAAAAGEPLGWPGRTLSNAGELLSAASLRGELNAVAVIDRAPGGPIAWDVTATLEHGSAAPTDEMDAMLAEEGMLWPQQLAPTELRGIVRVDPRRVDIDGISGAIGDAVLGANGSIDLAGAVATSTFDVTLDGLELAPWMVDLAPDTQRSVLRGLWNRFEADGIIDARLHALVPTDEPAELALDIAPKRLTATLGGQRVDLNARGGDIRSDLRTIWMRDLELDVVSDGRADGTIGLRGMLQAATGGDGQIDGSWRDARFECGVIAEALRAVGLPDLLEVMRSLDPRGTFDADFTAQVIDGRRLGPHTLTVHPHDLEATLDGEALSVRFEPAAALVVAQDRLALRDLRGTHATGTFDIGGGATWSSVPSVDLTLAADSNAFTPTIRGLLPNAAQSAIDAVNLAVSGPISIEGKVRLDRVPTGGWRSGFDGTLHVVAATLDAGFAIDAIAGAVEITGGGGGGQPPSFELRSQLDSLQVEGRRVNEPRGSLRLIDDGSALRVDSINGELFDGRVDVDGRIAMEDGGAYSLRIGMAGVDLASATERLPAPLPEGEVELPAADVNLPLAPNGARAAGESGRFDLRFDIGGRRGDALSRRGRGAVRVRDAAMADMPLTLQLLQISQLMLPLRASLPMADASFYVVGDTLTFERLELQSETLRLVGEGSLDLANLTLSTRFSPRGTLLLVSDLVQPFSNNLYVIDVTGPFSDPRASIVPLPSLGAALFGGRGDRRSSTGPASLADPESVSLRPLRPERSP